MIKALCNNFVDSEWGNMSIGWNRIANAKLQTRL